MSQLGFGPTDIVGSPFDLYVPLTGFTITARNGKLILNPAGTLATGTVTFPISPPDGAMFQLMSTQTQTAITLSAPTYPAGSGPGGTTLVDTIKGTAVSALVANTVYEWSYSLNGDIQLGTSARSWFRTR